MGIKTGLLKLYGRLEALIAPNLKYSQDVYEEVLQSNLPPGTRWLDLGCGHHVLPWWRSEAEKRLVERCELVLGIDRQLRSLQEHETIRLRVQSDIGSLPVADDRFDVVTANKLVEHLDDPAVQFCEVKRVLKPNGLFIFHTPNARGYFAVLARLVPASFRKRLVRVFEVRKEKDVFQTYYRANTPSAISRLAAGAGLEILDLKMIVTSAVFQIIPPLVVAELIWIRVLMTRPFKSLRTNMIVMLKKAVPVRA